MYENLTYEELLKEKLKLIDNSFDKRQGSIIFDTLAPNSAESIQIYKNLDLLIDRTFADTATGEDLERRVWERHITRVDATSAILKAVFKGKNGEAFDVEEGERFSGGGYDYYAGDKIEDGCFKLICETKGNSGNRYIGSIVPVDYIEGFLSGEIIDIIVYGEDKESDESLRKRYFDSFQTKAFGGNIEDYKRIFNEIKGVGKCKIYPAYYGGGTVRVVIINNGFEVPEESLIKDIQQYIDPKPKGSGMGAVPIGHDVSVEPAGTHIINISFRLTIVDGYEEDFVLEEVRNKIEDYFLELRTNWGEENDITVRSSRVEMRALEVKGVIDIENIKLNNNPGNVVVASDNIPILGTVDNV